MASVRRHLLASPFPLSGGAHAIRKARVSPPPRGPKLHRRPVIAIGLPAFVGRVDAGNADAARSGRGRSTKNASARGPFRRPMDDGDGASRWSAVSLSGSRPATAMITQLAFAHRREATRNLFGVGRQLTPDQRVFVGALAGPTMRGAAVGAAVADTEDTPAERRCMDDTPKMRPIV